jgi:hypothetical protein
VASTLQIFAVKVIALRGGLQWLIDVYGLVAIRDPLDRNRNTIFYRKRENCQTLTQQVCSISYHSPFYLFLFVLLSTFTVNPYVVMSIVIFNELLDILLILCYRFVKITTSPI